MRMLARRVEEPRINSALCVDFTGYTRSIRELLMLFHGADLLITNDGGPGHFASLTPIRTMVFFGPETGRLYGPLGHVPISVLESGMACSPCLSAYNHRLKPFVMATTSASSASHQTLYWQMLCLPWPCLLRSRHEVVPLSWQQRLFLLVEWLKGFRYIKFGMVGASGTVVNLVVLYTAHEYLFRAIEAPGSKPYASLALAIAVATVNNFSWNRLWTWADRLHQSDERIKQKVAQASGVLVAPVWPVHPGLLVRHCLAVRLDPVADQLPALHAGQCDCHCDCQCEQLPGQ
jgi:putative flippase GtrA